MKAVCAWCNLDLGERPGPAEAITHTICPACAKAQLAKAGIRVQRDESGVGRPVPSALNNWLRDPAAQEVGK